MHCGTSAGTEENATAGMDSHPRFLATHGQVVREQVLWVPVGVLGPDLAKPRVMSQSAQHWQGRGGHTAWGQMGKPRGSSPKR